jgi:ABC-2 type transport system ATP-binding protein
MIIELKDIHKKINGKWILGRINLEIKENCLLGIFGPNGSGKSTLLKIMTTAIKPTKGTYKLLGISDIQKIRKNIGVVFQTTSLDMELTVLENMEFHSIVYLGYVDNDRINFLLNKFSLEKYKDYKVKELSGGNIRRLEIIRSLIHRPKVLFLDEPDSGLDPKIRKSLWNMIKGLKKDMTVVLITHNINEVESICDLCVFLNKGKIVKIGAPAEIKNELGKEIVKIKSNDPKTLYDKLKIRFEKLKIVNNIVEIIVDDTKSAIVEIINRIKDFEEISIKKPSLEDYLIETMENV